MKVHPVPPKKRNITFRCDVGRSLSAAEALLGRQKKLRRLPHIFSKMLELPFAADADVDIQEGADGFQFVVAAAGGVVGEGVRAQAVEIHPGVTKVVIRDDDDGDGGGNNLELLLDELELDRWRFRLPPCTRPELASAVYAGGELIVTVPKGAVANGEDGGGEEVWGEGNGGLGGGGRLIVVQ